MAQVEITSEEATAEVLYISVVGNYDYIPEYEFEAVAAITKYLNPEVQKVEVESIEWTGSNPPNAEEALKEIEAAVIKYIKETQRGNWI